MYRLEKVLHPRMFYTVLDSLYFPELSWIAATDNQNRALCGTSSNAKFFFYLEYSISNEYVILRSQFYGHNFTVGESYH